MIQKTSKPDGFQSPLKQATTKEIIEDFFCKMGNVDNNQFWVLKEDYDSLKRDYDKMRSILTDKQIRELEIKRVFSPHCPSSTEGVAFHNVNPSMVGEDGAEEE